MNFARARSSSRFRSLACIPLFAVWCAEPLARGDEADSQPAPATAPATQPSVVVVRGQVLNHVGSGVEHVAVTVDLARDGEPVRLGTAQTDRLGDFEVMAEERVKGKLLVRFERAGFTAVTREVDADVKGRVPFVDVELAGGLTVAGRVMDFARETPIAAAKVIVRSVYKELTDQSDEDGGFEVEEVMPGPGELVVEAEGFGRHRQELNAVEGMDPLKIELKPQRIVHVSIVDAESKPIGGATIEALDQERNDFRSAVTGPDGEAVFRGVHFDAAELKVRLTHERYASSVQFDRLIELPGSEVESRHTLSMTAAGIVSGMVKDAATDTGLRGARIIAGPKISDRMPMAWTDFEGTFKLTGIPPGEAVLTVHLSGHSPGLKVVTVAPLEEVHTEISLPAAATARGAVVDADGKPIPEAYVWTSRWRGHETLGLQTLCDESGKFVIENAPPDEFEIVVMASGYEPLQGAKLSAAQTDATFTLKPRMARGPAGASPRSGGTAPAIALTTLDGTKLSLDKLNGKVVLLDFWATWCGPCVGEVPNLVKVYEKYGSRDDFVMISVSLDQDERALRDFIKARKMHWHHAFGDDGGANAAADKYGVVGIPALFLIDKQGKIAASELRGGAVGEQVDALLKAEK